MPIDLIREYSSLGYIRHRPLALLLPLEEKYPKGNGIYSINCKELYMVFEGTPNDHPGIGMVNFHLIEVPNKSEFDSFNRPGFCCILKTEIGYWIKTTTLPTFPLCALVGI